MKTSFSFSLQFSLSIHSDVRVSDKFHPIASHFLVIKTIPHVCFTYMAERRMSEQQHLHECGEFCLHPRRYDVKQSTKTQQRCGTTSSIEIFIKKSTLPASSLRCVSFIFRFSANLLHLLFFIIFKSRRKVCLFFPQRSHVNSRDLRETYEYAKNVFECWISGCRPVAGLPFASASRLLFHVFRLAEDVKKSGKSLRSLN